MSTEDKKIPVGFAVLQTGTIQIGKGAEMEEMPYRFTKELGYQVYREDQWVTIVMI